MLFKKILHFETNFPQATIATAIQEKLKEGRRRNLLEKMQDLLAVPGLATVISLLICLCDINIVL